MAVLNCSFSPLVFAELYSLLLRDEVRRDALIERLASQDFDIDWLALMAQEYDAKWRSDTRWLTLETIGDSVLDAEHSIVATWLLAGLRHTGHSYDLSSELRMAVARRAAEEFDGLPPSLPPALSPIVVGWTLGKVVGSVDGSVPVVPAYPLDDPDVHAAYIGLVEHVASLPGDLDLFPELVGSATYVRSAGLAEALAGGEDGPRKAIGKLMAESSLLTPSSLHTRLHRHWSDFVDRRNVLTHVRADGGNMTFVEAADQTRSWQQLKLTVDGITLFVCQAISRQLYNEVPPAVHGDPWEKFIKRDLETWD